MVCHVLQDLLFSHNKGRVEVNFNGEWGTVYDDLWSTNVAWRQLGFAAALSALRVAMFEKVAKFSWTIYSTATHLFSFPHNSLGSHNCGHSDNDSVVCTDICIYRSNTAINIAWILPTKSIR